MSNLPERIWAYRDRGEMLWATIPKSTDTEYLPADTLPTVEEMFKVINEHMGSVGGNWGLEDGEFVETQKDLATAIMNRIKGGRG